MLNFAGNKFASVHVAISVLSGNSLSVFWEIHSYIHIADWFPYKYRWVCRSDNGFTTYPIPSTLHMLSQQLTFIIELDVRGQTFIRRGKDRSLVLQVSPLDSICALLFLPPAPHLILFLLWPCTCLWFWLLPFLGLPTWTGVTSFYISMTRP